MISKNTLINNVKKFAATIAVVSLPLFIHAQEVRFGGGYSASQVSKAGEEQWKGKAGYHLGADLLLGSKVFAKAGLHLQIRNVGFTIATASPTNPTAPDVEFKYTDRHLRVPLQVGIRLLDPSEDPPVNIYAFAGPTILFKLNADLNDSGLNVETNGKQWYVGAGAGLNFGPIFVEGGYDAALSSVFEGNVFNTNPKLNLLYASAGIRLRLAK